MPVPSMLTPSSLLSRAVAWVPILATSAWFGADAHAVIGGRPVSAADWPEVVALMYPGEDGLEPGCSGTLIAPRVVLTAAHCLAHVDGVAELDPVAVRFGADDLSAGGTDLRVRRVRAMSNGLDGFDLGLVFLERDAPVRPAPLARGSCAARRGGRVTLVGYGVTDRETHGVLHAVELGVSELSCRDPELGCVGHGKGGAYLVATPGGMCGGDSGGPIFVVTPSGRYVAGVVSGPAADEQADECDHWHRALYPRPDTVIGWIERQIGARFVEAECR